MPNSSPVIDLARQFAAEHRFFALIATGIAVLIFAWLAPIAHRLVSRKQVAYTLAIVAFPLTVIAAAVVGGGTAHRFGILESPDALEFLKRAGISYGSVCAVMSVYCAAFLSADKLNAVRNRRLEARGERPAYRVPEGTLHKAELLGGWPGSLMAQGLLRHKVSKPAYQRKCWGAVAAHAGLVAAACLGAGGSSIASAVAIAPLSLAIGAVVLSIRYASAERRRGAEERRPSPSSR